jgi:hypothetical protein
MPPATKLTTGSLPSCAMPFTRSYGAPVHGDEQLVAHPFDPADLAEDVAQWRTVDAVPVPASPWCDHRRALVDPAQGFAEVPATAHERDLSVVDVVVLIRRRENPGPSA